MQRRSTGWQRGTTMSKTLYLECYSGISGDMTVAALLDLGADREVLKESLKSLPVGGFRTEITRVKKSGLDACDFSVILEQDNHDHDMEYLHGSEKSYTGHHEYTHSHEYPHEHRGMKEITEIIQKSEMTARAISGFPESALVANPINQAWLSRLLLISAEPVLPYAV